MSRASQLSIRLGQKQTVLKRCKIGLWCVCVCRCQIRIWVEILIGNFRSLHAPPLSPRTLQNEAFNFGGLNYHGTRISPKRWQTEQNSVLRRIGTRKLWRTFDWYSFWPPKLYSNCRKLPLQRERTTLCTNRYWKSWVSFDFSIFGSRIAPKIRGLHPNR